MTLDVVTPPTISWILLPEAKDHLRVRHSDDDGYIQALIGALTDVAESVTRRALFTQTLKLYLDSFECREIILPKPPLVSVTHVKYYDVGGTLTTLDGASYQVDNRAVPGRIAPAPTLSWPTIQTGRLSAVEVQYVCGLDSRGKLPLGLRQAMLYHLSHLYDVREPVVIGTIVANIPFTMSSMYAPYRVMRFF